MKITISQSLRRLRRERGNTQTDLAAHLGISMQAVSKWETGDGYPDIELLPAIASYYNVPIDELLGVGEIHKRERLEQYWAHDLELGGEGENAVRLALWREAYAELPNEPEVVSGLMKRLINNLYIKLDGGGEYAVSDEVKAEIVRHGEWLLDNAQGQPRDSAIQMLCLTYKAAGDLETARKYARMAPPYSSSRNLHMLGLYSGDDNVQSSQENLIELAQHMYLNAAEIASTDARRASDALTFAQGVFELLFPDGNFGFYHGIMSDINWRLAAAYAGAADCDRALARLQSMAEHALAFDKRKAGTYTSPLADLIEIETGIDKTYKGGSAKEWLRRLDPDLGSKDRFAALRADPRFAEIVARLRESAE
jgi:transcriptional regulator with XRE-family HTH domain